MTTQTQTDSPDRLTRRRLEAIAAYRRLTPAERDRLEEIRRMEAAKFVAKAQSGNGRRICPPAMRRGKK